MKSVNNILGKFVGYTVLCVALIWVAMFAFSVNHGDEQEVAAKTATVSLINGTKSNVAIRGLADYTEVKTSEAEKLEAQLQEKEAHAKKLEEQKLELEAQKLELEAKLEEQKLELEERLEEAKSHEGWFYKAKKSIGGWFAAKACDK